MKNLKTLLLPLLLSISLVACGSDRLKWNYDGTVSSEERVIKTSLQNAYTAQETPSGLFLGGFKIDDQGINYPYIAYVSRDLSQQQEWPMDDMVSQIFVFDDQVYVVLSEGEALSLQGAEWNSSDLKFKPDSIVVWSDKDIIACTPSPLPKASTGQGSCYSLFNRWKVSANWQTQKPIVCEGYLLVPDRHGSEMVLRQIDITNGDVVKNKTLKKEVSDWCSVDF
ncbi:hypothetical protein [Hahella sp. CCB-MM4]|uniref:hypothetical protein n=1 Tax=Hahella sp. (strain CCB-MM4) TaxID=1926491 RepID=UPI00113FE937|nr:hypothetical protein [Hahella sp. CCB-MM4]